MDVYDGMNKVLRMRMTIGKLLKHMAPILISLPILIVLNTSLFDSPFKYWVIFLEIGLVCSFYLLIFYKVQVSVRLRIKALRFLNVKTFDILTILLGAYLFLINALGLDFLNNVITAVLVTSFGLGYGVLRFLNFNPFVTRVEWLLLSFFVGIPVNCFLFSFSLIFTGNKRPIILSFLYFIFILVTLFPRLKGNSPKKGDEIIFRFNLGEASSLVLGVGFVILSLIYMYPRMAYLPGIDIARHFSSSLLVNLNPREYSSPYPWFHFQMATIQLLSGQSIGAFLTVLASFGILLFLAIFLLSKVYLDELDERLPALSTVLWTMFSGFGWISVFSLKESVQAQDPIVLLGKAFIQSFWDVGYGQGPWLWLWFRPFAIGVMGLSLLLYLLKRGDLSSSTFLTLAFLVSLATCMIHFPEFVFFVVLSSFISIFFETGFLRLRDVNYSSIASLIVVLGLSSLYSLLGLQVLIPIIFMLMLLAFPMISLVWHRCKQLQASWRIIRLRERWTLPIILGALVFWASSVIYWKFRMEELSLFASNFVRQVPWVFYPVLLGINGLLAIIQLLFMIKERRYHALFFVFITILALSLIYGKVITFLHICHLHIEYWERRTVALTFLASSFLAAPGLIRILAASRRTISALLLSIIIFSGVASTALSVEFQYLSASRRALSQSELEDLRNLSEIDYYHYLLPTSLRSLYISEYFPFKWRIKWFRNQILQAQSGELVMNALFSTGYPVVIYTGERGEIVLKENYSRSYIFLHVLKISPALDENVTHLFRLPSQAPPAEKSEVVLVLPEDVEPDSPIWYGLDLLSLAGYNYTTALISDLKTLESANVLIFPSVNMFSQISELKNLMRLPEHIIVLNLEGKNVSDPWVKNFQSINSINITFLNLFSFVKSLENGMKDLYYELGMIIRNGLEESSDLFRNYTFQENPVNSGRTAAFRNASIQGRIRITFHSITIMPVSKEVRINGKTFTLPQNTSYLAVLNYDHGTIVADYAEIIPGKGFYLRILLNNATISFENGPAALVAFLNGSPAYSQENVRFMSIEKVEVLTRRTFIEGKGEISFEDFYAYDSLYREIGVLGEDCKISGNFSFFGLFGDQYSVVRDLMYEGPVYTTANQYQDMGFFKGLLGCFLPAIIFAAFIGQKPNEGEEGVSNEKEHIDRT